MKESKEDCQRTTIYLPKELYHKVKLMALMCETSVSRFMRIALRDKIKELEKK
jgi:hypothetical protein